MRWLTAVLVAALAASAGLAWFRVRARSAEPVPAPPAAAVPSFPAPAAIGPRDWTVLRAPTSTWLGSGAASNSPGRRYRLAGTFLVSEGPDAKEAAYRKAILDDTQAKKQHLLAEGETVEDLRVVRVHADRVVVDIGGRVEVLGLGFAGGAGEAPAAVSAVAAAAAGMEALETTRYGKRVQENRWLLSRDELMKYYRDILDDPERIAKLYDTFRPDYAEGRIAGYEIAMQGEQDFLRDVGLREGDKVRMVNSMLMSSQSRAEFFLGEFVKERLNAVVLDIEREGKPQKIIYLIR